MPEQEGGRAQQEGGQQDDVRGGRPLGERPLTARSVLASTLLGSDPPRLPVSFLVRTCALFGLAEGTVRTALSRMVAAGEVVNDGDGWYSLTGDLVARQERQRTSRAAETREWSGRWRLAVVAPGARPAAERAEMRRVMAQLRFAEQRDGVWLRPDNLERNPGIETTVDALGRCTWFVADPDLPLDRSDAELAASLWDLAAWAQRADELRRAMRPLASELEAGDRESLAPGFVLSAAVLRHFVADPLLPRELLPRDWPGAALRRDYDRYDALFRRRLREWSGRPGD